MSLFGSGDRGCEVSCPRVPVFFRYLVAPFNVGVVRGVGPRIGFGYLFLGMRPTPHCSSAAPPRISTASYEARPACSPAPYANQVKQAEALAAKLEFADVSIDFDQEVW